MDNASDDDARKIPDLEKSPALRSVIEALARLKFGAIQLTVHEGKLVQVDVTERQRFSS